MKFSRHAWGTFSALVFGMLAACSGPAPLEETSAASPSGSPSEAPQTTNDPTKPAGTDAGTTSETGSSTPAPSPGPSGSAALDMGVTDTIDDLGFDFAKAHADGLTRTTFYTMWRHLEPSDGVYKFADIDDMTKRAAAAGLRLSLEIEITNTDCVDYGMSDAFCVASKFPSDVPFNRKGAGFADPAIARRLGALVSAIAARYDASVLTHVYVGNEVDRYIEVVRHDDKIDLTGGFVTMLGAVHTKLAASPKRPKFGTVVEFQPRADYLTVPPKACPNVDVLGLTMYPTEPDAEGTDPAPAKIQRWLAAARTSIVGSCSLAVTEVGASAIAPFGSPDAQQAIAAAIVTWLKANRGVYDYTTWFAMADNPDPTDSVFGGMGLETRTHVPRPAYTTWLSAGKP